MVLSMIYPHSTHSQMRNSSAATLRGFRRAPYHIGALLALGALDWWEERLPVWKNVRSDAIRKSYLAQGERLAMAWVAGRLDYSAKLSNSRAIGRK
jgi:hypothetical protein